MSGDVSVESLGTVWSAFSDELYVYVVHHTVFVCILRQRKSARDQQRVIDWKRWSQPYFGNKIHCLLNKKNNDN